MKAFQKESVRIAALALASSVLFVAIATTGTWDDPYGPNDWAFSHVTLAKNALESESIPLNERLLTQNEFRLTRDAFQEEVGFPLFSYYANTAWHFWNGLPLHPAFVATASAATGLTPDAAIRLPMAGVATVLLTFATAALALTHSRGDARLASAAPILVACACAPLALDLRVAMPSLTLVALLLVAHAMARRAFLGDRRALWLAATPLLILPLWYYTMAYFAILLFAGFFGARLVAHITRADVSEDALVPWPLTITVPIFLVAVLLSTGTLASHYNMATILTDGAAEEGAGADYTMELNRDAWRSGVLYAQLAVLFLPLGLLSLGALRDVLRRRRVGRARALFAQWAAGAAAFSAVLVPTVGVSFLNRSVIYLAPVAIVAGVYLVALHVTRRSVRAAAASVMAFGLAVTPLYVATAMPTYDEEDRTAFEWAQEHLPSNATVYSSLEISSVLLREHGFLQVNSFQPSVSVLNVVWYGSETEPLVPFIASMDYVVVSRSFTERGFEEFGPAREPITPQAYSKFSRSPDMHRLYDNGEIQIFRVALHPERFV